MRAMKTRLLSLAAMLASLCLPVVSIAEPAKPKTAEKTAEPKEAEKKETLPDYIRSAEDDQSNRLEIAIKTFALPSGQKVDLIGVVHIADAD